MNKITEKEYNAWYFQLPVQYKMAEYLKDREFACLSQIHPNRSIRTLRVHSPQHFQFWTKKVLRSKTQPEPFYNYYYSLATFKGGLPLQNCNLKERDNSEFKKNAHKLIKEYDFLIDIDAPTWTDLKKAHHQTRQVIKRLRTPFFLIFSGMGFHIIMPYRFTPMFSTNKYNLPNMYEYVTAILKKMNKKYDMVDTRIGDSRRLCKIPYTLSVYKDRSYSVCFPFQSMEEFENFSEEQTTIQYWLGQDIQVRKKTLLNQNG